jgi:hypothetical protein
MDVGCEMWDTVNHLPFEESTTEHYYLLYALCLLSSDS